MDIFLNVLLWLTLGLGCGILTWLLNRFLWFLYAPKCKQRFTLASLLGILGQMVLGPISILFSVLMIGATIGTLLAMAMDGNNPVLNRPVMDLFKRKPKED